MNAITWYGSDAGQLPHTAVDSRLVSLLAARARKTAPVAPSEDHPFGDLKGIIGRALNAARAMGRDDITCARAAAHAIMAVRPDLTMGEAMKAVFSLDVRDAA